MSEHSQVRCLLLSLVTAVAGAGALVLSGPASPSVAVPAPAAVRALAPPPLTGSAASTLSRAVPDLPEVSPRDVLASQTAAGLSCRLSAEGVPLCVHGEDEPHAAAGDAGAVGTPRGGTIGCYGDGTGGPRVRVVYARPQSAPDRYAGSVGSIRAWAAGISSQVDASAARTGGRRHVRYATTPGRSCTLTVLDVVLPDSAFGSFGATIDALQARGLDTPWSKYLVWSDGTGYCGMGTTYADDSPRLDNLNNGKLPGYARIDRRCWGKVETHELVHMLGGVQRSAPNSTASFHCSDGLDVLCYDDGSARSRQRSVCGSDRAQQLDCRNDDYFSTAAPRGSYLQTHWNTARSSFLAAATSDPAPTARPTGAATPSPAASASPAPTSSPRPAGSPSPRPGPLDGIVVLPTLVAWSAP